MITSCNIYSSNNDSLVLLGFWFIISLLFLSNERAISWRPSVTKFNHNNWIATNGIGKFMIIDVKKNNISDKPHDIKNRVIFLIFE